MAERTELSSLNFIDTTLIIEPSAVTLRLMKIRSEITITNFHQTIVKVILALYINILGVSLNRNPKVHFF